MLGKKKGKKDPFNIIENPLSVERLSLPKPRYWKMKSYVMSRYGKAFILFYPLETKE
jgi:hypothetical protein